MQDSPPDMISFRRLAVSLAVGAVVLATASIQVRALSVDGDHLALARAGMHRGFEAAVELQTEVENGRESGIARALAAIELAMERRAADGRPGRGPLTAFDVLSCKQTADHPSDCAPGRSGAVGSAAERISAAYRALEGGNPDGVPTGGRGPANRGNAGNEGGRG